MSESTNRGVSAGSVIPLFSERTVDHDLPPVFDIDDLELELVIACGLALREVADRLEVSMEDVCAQLVRLGSTLD